MPAAAVNACKSAPTNPGVCLARSTKSKSPERRSLLHITFNILVVSQSRFEGRTFPEHDRQVRSCIFLDQISLLFVAQDPTNQVDLLRQLSSLDCHPSFQAIDLILQFLDLLAMYHPCM